MISAQTHCPFGIAINWTVALKYLPPNFTGGFWLVAMYKKEGVLSTMVAKVPSHAATPTSASSQVVPNEIADSTVDRLSTLKVRPLKPLPVQAPTIASSIS